MLNSLWKWLISPTAGLTCPKELLKPHLPFVSFQVMCPSEGTFAGAAQNCCSELLSSPSLKYEKCPDFSSLICFARHWPVILWEMQQFLCVLRLLIKVSVKYLTLHMPHCWTSDVYKAHCAFNVFITYYILTVWNEKQYSRGRERIYVSSKMNIWNSVYYAYRSFLCEYHIKPNVLL